MRILSLSLLVVIIMVLTSGCSSGEDEKSIAATATVEAYEKSREATIEAFVTYREGRERLLDVSPPSKYYEARIDALNVIDLRDVDKDLKTFFSVLNDEFEDLHSQWEKAEEEAEQLGFVIGGGAAVAETLAGDDAILQFLGGLIVGGLSQEAINDFNKKHENELNKIYQKHLPKEKELLKTLSKRYDYPFYEAVFGE